MTKYLVNVNLCYEVAADDVADAERQAARWAYDEFGLDPNDVTFYTEEADA